MSHKSWKLPFKHRLKGKVKLLATQFETPWSKLNNYTAFLGSCSKFLCSLSLPVKNKQQNSQYFYYHHWQEKYPGMKIKHSWFLAFLAAELQGFCHCPEAPPATEKRAPRDLQFVKILPLLTSVFQNTKEQRNLQSSYRNGTVAWWSSLLSRSEQHKSSMEKERDIEMSRWQNWSWALLP